MYVGKPGRTSTIVLLSTLVEPEVCLSLAKTHAQYSLCLEFGGTEALSQRGSFSEQSLNSNSKRDGFSLTLTALGAKRRSRKKKYCHGRPSIGDICQ